MSQMQNSLVSTSEVWCVELKYIVVHMHHDSYTIILYCSPVCVYLPNTEQPMQRNNLLIYITHYCMTGYIGLYSGIYNTVHTSILYYSEATGAHEPLKLW